MPVRDVEWYSAPRDRVTLLSNRGANGIDGVLSTAIGVALAGGAPTVALVGDLAFLYDAGALLGSGRRPLALTIVVVDNDGGGIFSFLPQAAALPEAQFERFWGTPHGGDLAAIAAAYGVEVVQVGDRDALDAGRGGSGSTGRPGGDSEVVRQANVAAHDRLHGAIAEAVASVLGAGAGAVAAARARRVGHRFVSGRNARGRGPSSGRVVTLWRVLRSRWAQFAPESGALAGGSGRVAA